VTPLEGVSRVGCGSSSRLFFLSCFGCRGAGLEADAVVSGLNDVAVVGQPVEQGRGHLGVTEDAGPFGEAEVGGDDDAGLLVELGEQVEE
jgi:catechol 2,3-dioxygenase-like lactoylglutathione lyase family enzyme